MKHIILVLGLLTINSLSVLAQNQLPSPRYGAAYCKVSDTSVFIYGGVVQDNSKSNTTHSTNDLYHYDPSNQTFTKITPSGDELPLAHGAFMAYDHNTGKMTVLGGLRSTADNAFYSFDPHAFQVSKKTQQTYSQRGYMSGGYTGGGKWLLSGGQLANGTASSAVYEYNASTGTFTQKSDIPQGTALYGHTSISDTLNNKVYIFGGLNGSGTNNFSCYEFSTSTNSWGFGPNIQNYPQNEWSAFPATGRTLLDNEIFIVGGQKYSAKKSTNSITFSTNLYTVRVVNGTLVATLVSNNIPPMIGGVAWCSLETNNDIVFYMFGGINSITSTGDTTFTNNFYRYNQTSGQIQQYDTTQQVWGGILSAISENNLIMSKELSIFPNPASDKITFRLNTNETIKSIKIYNNNGQLIKVVNYPNNEIINIEDLANGLYFLRVETNKNFYLGKMIKK